MKNTLLLTPVQLETVSFKEQRIHFEGENCKVVLIHGHEEQFKHLSDLKEVKFFLGVGSADEAMQAELTKAHDQLKAAQDQVTAATAQYDKLNSDFDEQSKNLTAANAKIGDLEGQLKSLSDATKETATPTATV